MADFCHPSAVGMHVLRATTGSFSTVCFTCCGSAVRRPQKTTSHRHPLRQDRIIVRQLPQPRRRTTMAQVFCQHGLESMMESRLDDAIVPRRQRERCPVFATHTFRTDFRARVYAAALSIGLILLLCRTDADAKNPPQRSITVQVAHSGMYSCFQSLIDRRAKRHIDGSRRQSWLL